MKDYKLKQRNLRASHTLGWLPKCVSRFGIFSFQIFNLPGTDEIPLQLSGEMPRASKGLEEGDIQKLHTTPPEQLTDEELLLSTFCVDDLQRKSSAGWDIPSAYSAGNHTGTGLLERSSAWKRFDL